MATTKARYPSKLTIGDNTYTIEDTPELKQFFDATVVAAAQLEKEKLYDQLSQSKSEVEKLKEENGSLLTEAKNMGTNIQQIIADFDKQKNEMQEKMRLMQQNVAVDRSEMANIIAQTFAEQLPTAMQSYLKPVTSSVEELKVRDMMAYRDSRIAEKAGRIIVEMVPEVTPATTPQDVDAAVQRASATYERLFPTPPPQTTAPQLPPQGAPQTPGHQAAPGATAEEAAKAMQGITVPPAVPNLPVSGEVDLPDFKTMSDEEYAANRGDYAKRLAKLMEAYRNPAK